MSLKDAVVGWLHDSIVVILVWVLMSTFVFDAPTDWMAVAVFLITYLVLRVARRKHYTPNPRKWYYGYLPKPLFRKKRQ